MKTGKIVRTLSLLLALLMLAGMIPAAFATEKTENEIQEAAAGEQPVAESASGEEEETSEPENGSVIVYRAFDVSLQKDGQEVAAEGEFRVTVETGLDAGSLIPEEAVCTGVSWTLYHIHGDEVEIVEDAAVDEDGILTFTTPNFSTFVLQYTVDFAFEKEDGTVYEFSMPGGSCISVYSLAQELGLAEDDPQTEEDEVQVFIDNIEDVTFSSPELVFIGKAEAYFTVGNIKEGVGLECQYSEELTEEDIAAINSQIIKPGDWAVISLQPFTSAETLTITMKDGKTYTVQVTDAQITQDYITASGETYTITVEYEDDANIPNDVELSVREILPETEEYEDYMAQSAEKLGVEINDVSFARFFDIEIVKDGEKIEPDVPVQVTIAYKDALEIAEDQTLSVIHFAEDGEKSGPEIITDITLNDSKTELTYQQTSFSVSGTIIAGGDPNNGPNNGSYMVLLRYPIDSENYYIVNNDGSLTKVPYNNGTVTAEYPMLWTVVGSNPNRHIYFDREATGFNGNNLAVDYYYRYIDPSVPSGITEETDANITVGRRQGDEVVTGGVVLDRGAVWNQTAANTYGNHVYTEPWSNSNHLGVELDEDGTPIRIAGQKAGNDQLVAEVYFAEAAIPTNIGARTHTVNHIDISISGKSEVNVPLAFGTYYYKDANDNWQEYVVTSNTSIDLKKDNVRIEPEDMKRAVIKAYDKNGNELDDAYVVTGYSSNAANGVSTVQVRIEGVFKVANLENVPDYVSDPNDWYWKGLRNDNRITYTVSATKPLEYDLIETENGYGQLYEKLADGTYRPLSIKVDINMSASFGYWDEGNECPAIHDDMVGTPGVNATWQNGGIPMLWNRYQSGMDFILGGDADDANAKIVAIEITKMIVDKDNHLIPLKRSIVQSFDVYGSSTDLDSCNNVVGVNVSEYTADYTHYDVYSNLHSKDVQVGTSGMGLVFDYDITPGMYYIVEDADDIPELIVDENNNIWQYKETKLETEYVWRNDMYSGRHVSQTYSADGDAYRSIPEVAGNYTGLRYSANTEQPIEDYNSTNWVWHNNQTGEDETGTYRNGFLEFFVYNYYEPKKYPVFIKKVDANDTNGTGLAGAEFDLYGPYEEVRTTNDDNTTTGRKHTKINTTAITTDENGTVKIGDLSDGIYYLYETKAPDGYLILTEPLEITVNSANEGTETSVVIVDSDKYTVRPVPSDPNNQQEPYYEITIPNTPGIVLPETGGIGTAAFYLLGGGLLLAAALLLVRRKKFLT